MTQAAGRILRPIISEAEQAKLAIKEEIDKITKEYVDDIYASIFAAAEANKDKPMGHYLLKPDYVKGKEKAASRDKTSFYEWKSPGNRNASRVKRYGRWCEI